MQKVSVCILDYGSGNVGSVYNIITYLGYDVKVSNAENDIELSTHLILPGVGSFGSAMERINKNIPVDFLRDQVINFKKPFLGICVGMQVLVEVGLEHGEFKGLGWVQGTVEKLKTEELPLPHIGWNNVKIKEESSLFEDLTNINDFYFVHSYHVMTEKENILSETEYGKIFCSSLMKENIFGVQFHPEKSQKAGQKLLQNFLKIN